MTLHLHQNILYITTHKMVYRDPTGTLSRRPVYKQINNPWTDGALKNVLFIAQQGDWTLVEMQQ